ncbi:MAG: zinc-ribbon domain containing protein [Chloracidobacterium sp.]|nr:zinc-ribbon domain containing protein [Chloracidobacterium sp.]MDW8216429.1 zinc-ribbon domain containing protein [Acidobacteriota bacterium]
MDETKAPVEPVFEDIHLNCIECGAPFVFTAGEQQFFFDKGLKNQPKRCKPCKIRKNERFNQLLSMMATDGSRPRIQVEVECAECGVRTTVPFLPTQGRPVLCRDCFVRAQVSAQVTTKPPLKYAPPTVAQNLPPLNHIAVKP